jgi:hypothetical protein
LGVISIITNGNIHVLDLEVADIDGVLTPETLGESVIIVSDRERGVVRLERCGIVLIESTVFGAIDRWSGILMLDITLLHFETRVCSCIDTGKDVTRFLACRPWLTVFVV